MSCSGIIATMAMFSVYLLGSFLPWRHVAFISAFVPILNIIVAIFVSCILIKCMRDASNAIVYTILATRNTNLASL